MSTEVLRARCRAWHQKKYHSDPDWARRRNDNTKRWVREQKARGLCRKCTRPAIHKTVCEEHLWLGREHNWKKRGVVLTMPEFWERLEAQGRKCPLCLRSLDPIYAAVDHCHATGRVRGILCIRCNCAIGALGDTAESVARVVEYLGGRK